MRAWTRESLIYDYAMDEVIYVTKAGQFHPPDQDLLPL